MFSKGFEKTASLMSGAKRMLGYKPTVAAQLGRMKKSLGAHVDKYLEKGQPNSRKGLDRAGKHHFKIEMLSKNLVGA
jgi:hypothetical protein